MNSFVVLNTEFSSAHFYEQKKWDAKKNIEIFDACYTKYGHGHNYKWQVTLKNPSGEYLSNHKLALSEWATQSKIVLQSIAKPLDHQHLNFIIPEFANIVPTTENISLYLKDKLLQSELSQFIISFRLYEMENLWTQVQIQNPAMD